MSQSTTPARPVRQRSIQELRQALAIACEVATDVWSIPVDEERDFHCILREGIAELEALRAQVATPAAPATTVAEPPTLTLVMAPCDVTRLREALAAAPGIVRALDAPAAPAVQAVAQWQRAVCTALVSAVMRDVREHCPELSSDQQQALWADLTTSVDLVLAGGDIDNVEAGA